MKVHIKFLAHGRGSAAHASAYLLDRLDHRGNTRAGVQVLRGDATTFNAICDASPHLWKYTSGVIAWSKDDDPTHAQIMEVLNEFEEHAFAGLEQSQYHLFAVLHTDDDGSKHIHVLAPRLDIQSGKSLNIAPPGHEKHFDSFRDYFNTKYQWSRPDDLLLMKTTQEPNYINKINAQAEKFYAREDFIALTKKQFCKTIDDHIKTLLKTQIIQNRADIVECISQLKDVKSVKQSQKFLKVELSNGTTHRLRGDFYHEQFEIGLYSEHLRAAAESRKTASEFATALSDAHQFREAYRAKRATYNRKHYAFAQCAEDDNSLGDASQLIFERDRESIAPSNTNTGRELYSTNKGAPVTTCSYRYCGNFESEIENRFVFNINARVAEKNKQPVAEYLDRPASLTKEYTSPNTASDQQPKPTDRERNRGVDYGETGYAKSEIHIWGSDREWSVDDFNRFIYDLSNSYEHQDSRRTTTNDSTKWKSDYSSTQLFEHTKVVSHADRNRSIFDRTKQFIATTKQLISRTQRSLEQTGQFIKKYVDQLQRTRAEFREQDQNVEFGERSATRINYDDEGRAFISRTRRVFGAITARISSKLEASITNAINDSIQSAGFKNNAPRLSEDRIEACSADHQRTADRSQGGTLENFAISATQRFLQRFRDAKQANQYAWGNRSTINSINQQLERLEATIAEIRLKPKLAITWQLRLDGYYPGYVRSYKVLSAQQQQAYEDGKPLPLIEITEQKTKELLAYMNEASRNMDSHDYRRIAEIIKNDERMLNYVKCEVILSHKNNHLEDKRALYLSCLKNFDEIKERVNAGISSNHNSADVAPSRVIQPSYELETKRENSSDINFDF